MDEDLQCEEQIYLKSPYARDIVNAILQAFEEYPSDGTLSKFFLPEVFLEPSRLMAASLASQLYAPALSAEELFESTTNTLLMFASLWGVQTFLKERIYVRRRYSFRLLTDVTIVRKASTRALERVAETARLSNIVEEVFSYYLTRFRQSGDIDTLVFEGKRFRKKKFYRFLTSSLLWGYFFAKGITRNDII